ncbi:hypothetical protein IQ24_02655 [Paracoccus sulfuroxidans]|uniref:Uncharacterized protein n=1 Tax=Paracoccus sulfuroxidans TaxID=384678 RepID=A0A562NL31_9RHOB|nr:hypothetical protein IQ24_02655 [Paracoccus sulfuroxidans]
MANRQIPEHRVSYQCRTCERDCAPEDFYVSSKTQCKECVKARVRERARTNPSVQEYDRQRAKLPHRRKNSTNVTSRWRAQNPDGYKAHSAVSNAIRDGRLKREPCLFCGTDRVHAHHRDYARPLDVIWLCPKCHHRLHAAFPETEGSNKRLSK